MPDPKLKLAMEEIKEILKRHDIAAIVHLQSQAHGEFLYSLSPSWSCASLSDDGRFRFKADIKTKPETDKERARVTTGMLISFLDAAEKQKQDMTTAARLVGKHMEIQHRTDYEQ